jgi:hypothetical protein
MAMSQQLTYLVLIRLCKALPASNLLAAAVAATLEDDEVSHHLSRLV